MAAQPHPLPELGPLTRLAPVVAAVACVSAACVLHSAVLAAGQGAAAMDVPTSAAKPLGTVLVGLAALAALLLLPRPCVPGALLLAGGVAANLAALALWGAVPDPFGLAVAGGILHFDAADVCVVVGGALLAATMLSSLGPAAE